MRPYSVEIYSRDLILKDHNTIDYDSYEYKYDYLDPEQNKIKILKPLKAALYDYIRIFGNGRDIYGYITKLSNGDDDSKDLIEVSFVDLMNKFDIDIIADTSDLGQGYLEDYISKAITETYINNQDTKQNIEGLEIVIDNYNAEEWTLDLTGDDNDTRTKANLLDDIVIAAFRRYSVRVLFEFILTEKRIIAHISTNLADVIPIETRLSNILSKTIKYRQAKKEINKDLVANKKDYSMQRIYYLHSDGTHSIIDTDRLVPVYSKLETVSTKTVNEWAEKFESNLNKDISTIKRAQDKLAKGETLDEDIIVKEIEAAGELNLITGVNITIDQSTGAATGFDEETVKGYLEDFIGTTQYNDLCEGFAWDEFVEKADVKADKTFNSNKYENLIEIECTNDDIKLTPWNMEIGQIVKIYDNDSSYETILTAKKIKGTSTLIFGNERIELTKILKGRS